ncbi:hypothetical protein ACKUT9_04655 [Mycobacterium seoulense]|uniref:Short-chain dehydrogenase n=1 Tax=Mycobacterium paraseoulense TaxID=590652 RepID=A0A1X0IF80_9MYCO|nr:hypothetical protein BST39_05055 [Mycobacterium paraseoulense]
MLVVTGATRRIGREIAVRAAADGAAIGVTAEHPLPVTPRAQSMSVGSAGWPLLLPIRGT